MLVELANFELGMFVSCYLPSPPISVLFAVSLALTDSRSLSRLLLSFLFLSLVSYLHSSSLSEINNLKARLAVVSPGDSLLQAYEDSNAITDNTEGEQLEDDGGQTY